MIKFKSGKIFIHIPRTSGTNFRRNVHISRKSHRYIDYDRCEEFLSEVTTESGRELMSILLQGRCNPDLIKKYDLHLVKHLPLNVWEKYKVYTDEKIYATVRNPYTRLVSMYEESLSKMKLLFEFERPDLEKFIFNEKINTIADSFTINHKKTQVSYLRNLNGDFICEKYYKIEEDQESLKKDFLLKDPDEVEDVASTVLLDMLKDGEREYNKDYASIFTDRLIEWTQETFKEDFEYFSYDINPFWK